MSYNEQNLSHHGIKGQRCGVRRFQNADGSLTPKGRKRYGVSGTVSVENGRFIDTGTGKKISRKTRKMAENRMLKDDARSDEIRELNKKERDAKSQRNEQYMAYERAREHYEADKQRSRELGFTFEGFAAAGKASASRVLMENSEKSYREAEEYYKSVKTEVDTYVASYMNEHISDFKKN